MRRLLPLLMSLCAASCSPAYAGERTIYVCEQGYDPPCRKVPLQVGDDATDWAELIAAGRALRSKVETPVIRDKSGAIPQCGPSHGQTACCRIIAQVEEKTYIECG